jgi:hypothetical protein
MTGFSPRHLQFTFQRRLIKKFFIGDYAQILTTLPVYHIISILLYLELVEVVEGLLTLESVERSVYVGLVSTQPLKDIVEVNTTSQLCRGLK